MTENSMLDIKRQIEHVGDLKAALKDAYGDLFEKAIEHVFDAVPQLQKIRWTGSTPSFNDGDPCRFRLSEVEFYFDAESTAAIEGAVSDDDEDRGQIDLGKLGSYDDKWGFTYRPEFQAIGDFDDAHTKCADYIEERFGDNVEVVVHRGGKIDTNFYYCGY